MGILSRIVAPERRRGILEDAIAARRYAALGGSVAVTPSTVSSIPAFDAAVGFAADSVAQLVMRVWEDDEVGYRRVDTVWQSRLFRDRPNPEQDWYTFWWVVEASLTARRNAYIWKTPGQTQPVSALTALHPDQVRPRRQGRRIVYDAVFDDGYPLPPDAPAAKSVTVGRDRVLHIRGRGGVGEVEAPSPIRAFAASLGVALAKVEHERSIFERGASGGLVVSFPQTVTREQAERWRDQFEEMHAGPFNAGRVKVLGAGAEIKTIGMTQAEAQFVESVGLSVADIARICNVPLFLLGVRDAQAKPLSPEHEMQRWLYQGLAPRLARIESAINADEDLFLGSRYRAGFDTSDYLRGDLLTEDIIAHQQMQDGRIVANEWRRKHGLPPIPGGDIPQFTPVGGAPNPAALTPKGDDE